MPTPSLPTHPRSHRVRRLGAAVVCTALAAGATQGLATTDARAATTSPVTASAATVNRYLWVADALARHATTDLVPFVYYEKVLQTMYLDTPTLAPSVAAAELAKLRNAVNAHSASLVSGHGGQQQPGLLGVISSIIGNIKFRPQLVAANPALRHAAARREPDR